MTDDHDPRYDEATEPDQPVTMSADQPPLFEEPPVPAHDLEPVAEPEGSWEEPADELAWEPDPEPDPAESWEAPAEDSAEEPAQHHEPEVPATAQAPDEAPVLLAALAYQEVDERDLPAAPVPPVDALSGGDQAAEPSAVGADESAHGLEESADEGPVSADESPESDDEVGDDGADDLDAVPASGRSGGGAVALLSALVAALLLATAWLGYTVVDNRGAEPLTATRASALAAGRDAARLVFSYDYRHLDKDFAAGAAVTTGKFKTDYQSTTKKLVGDVAPRYKAVLLADVSEAGVITASANKVQLLVFLDVQSTSTLAATPKVTPRRLKMTMQRSGDRWLVSAVDAF
ncbi:MAG: hypothetical protein JWN31_43 [Frankiales bacterium]|nr:hypothetical protein [Frankiales bacterium]